MSGALGLPDEDFDYDRFVREEFGPHAPAGHRRAWFWLAVVALMVVLALLSVFGVFRAAG